MKRLGGGMTALFVVGLFVAQGCGGAAKSERAPATPSNEPAPGATAGSPAHPSTTPMGPSTTTESSPAPVPPDADGASDFRSRERVDVALSRARNALDAAERELSTSAGDCSTACRALGSMERATAHLCDLAASLDDRRRCEDAKTKVLVARERVKTTCGQCSGGPSLERTAPIPSVR